MKKNVLFGLLTAVTAFGVAALPAKADPIIVRTGTSAQVYSTAGVWTTVPGSAVGLNLTGTKLITARFSAESACYGASGWCSARVVVQNVATGAITELNPVVGTDFAFDSTDSNNETSGSWESHAINRSIRLPAGRYRFFVQVQPVFNGINFRVDDWGFEIEVL